MISKHETLERVTPGEVDKPLFEEHMMRYEFAATYAKGKEVADIGCGTGYGTRYLLESGGAKSVLGVDLSGEAIEYARRHYTAENLEFVVGDATALSLGDDSFELVVSFETIEHLKGYRDYIKEMHRILLPGGTFIVSTPNKRFSGRNPFHVVEFSYFELRELLESEFSCARIYGQDQKTLFQRLRLRTELVLARIVPEVIKDMFIPDRIRRGSPDRAIGGIVEDGLQNCIGLIGVCVK